MQVYKKINNNVVLCRDGHGRELVAFGKGLGFADIPYELTDMAKVQRTFYNISEQYMAMLETLPGDVVEFTAVVVDEARDVLPYELSPNLLLTMSDHISFALERRKKGILVKMPLAYDVEQNYPVEMEFANKVLRDIWKRFKVRLPKDEASGIAMGFLNARVYSEQDSDVRENEQDQVILDEITRMVEREMKTRLNVSSFNYARYASHVQYLLKRLRDGKGIESINSDLYEEIRTEYADTAACVDKIERFLRERYGFDMTEEEQLYLLLHVNRVCSNDGL